MIKKDLIDKILGQYQGKIYRLALSICRNEKDAEDILQNTLLKIVSRISTFKNRSQISTWIYRIAYNESLMYLRKKRRLFNSSKAYMDYNKRLPLNITINWSRLPDKELLDKELQDGIKQALKELPLEYRMPLLLHRIEKLSLAETAQILGIKSSTAKTRLHRAYLVLKRRLKENSRDFPYLEKPEDKLCPSWTGFLFNYFKQESSDKKEDFKRHIKDCPRCNLFLDTYQKAIQITGILHCKDIPPELKEKIKSFLNS